MILASNALRGVTINYLDNDFTLSMRVDAERAEWKNGHWIFYNLLMTHFDGHNSPVLEWSKQRIIDLPETHNDFKIMQKDAEKMGFFDLP